MVETISTSTEAYLFTFQLFPSLNLLPRVIVPRVVQQCNLHLKHMDNIQSILVFIYIYILEFLFEWTYTKKARPSMEM